MSITASVILLLMLPCAPCQPNVKKNAEYCSLWMFFKDLREQLGGGCIRIMAIVWTSRAVHANVCAVRAVFQAFNIVYCMSFSNIENTPLNTECALCPTDK